MRRSVKSQKKIIQKKNDTEIQRQREVIRTFKDRRELEAAFVNSGAFVLRRMDKNVLVFLFAFRYNPLFRYPLKVTFNRNHDQSLRPLKPGLLMCSFQLCDCWGGLPAGTQKVACLHSMLCVCPVPLWMALPTPHSTGHECARQTLLKISRWRPRRRSFASWMTSSCDVPWNILPRAVFLPLFLHLLFPPSSTGTPLQLFQTCLPVPYVANKTPSSEVHVGLCRNVFHCHVKLK